MDYNIETPDMPMEANQNNSPQISQIMSLPLLPKNCVALVGSTPVVLGQQVVIMDTKKSTGEIAAIVQSDAVRSHNKDAKSDSITSITSSPSTHASLISNVTPQNQLGQSSKASPGIGNIHVVKALTSKTQNRAVNVGPICVKPSMTDINLPNQTTSQTQKFQVPGNFSIRHMLAKRSRLNESEIKVIKPKPQFAVKFSPLHSGKSRKTQEIHKMPSFKSAHIPKPQLIEETSEIPKEVPSGSITVNLHGQAVKIVGLPVKYSQSMTSQRQKKEKETPVEKSKTTQLQSLYDKKMNTLKMTNSVFQKSSLPASDRFHVSHSPASGLSQILPKSSGQSRSLMIGNIASLSPQTQSHVLNNARQDRTSTCIITNQGLVTVPRTHHPTESSIIDLNTYKPTPVPSVIQPTTQHYPTLQTILRTSVTPKTFHSSSHIYSHPQTPTHQYYPQEAIKISPQISGKKNISSSNMQYYTSLETFNEGQPVMVVRPVLDSDNDSPTVYQGVTMGDSHVNSSRHSANVGDQAHLFSNTELQRPSNLIIDNEKSNSSSDLKIQSVFSLANISSALTDSGKNESMANNTKLDLDNVSDIIDVDDEEETTFNVYDPICKKVCPPSYVVLERLYPQDIEDKKMGRTKVSVQCSHHCRVRTLSYLCDLNLMDCENRLKHTDNTVNKESDPLPYTAIDVEEYDENDLSISRDMKQKEDSPLFSSVKELDGGIEESRKKVEDQDQASTNDEQNEGSQQNQSLQKNTRERRNTRPPNKFSPESQVDESHVQKDTDTLSHTETSNKLNEKDELISLKRQVDLKRLEMQKQKKGHKHNLKSKTVKKKNKTTAGFKAPSKQNSGKLPVILGSRLKPGIAVPNQSGPRVIKSTLPVSVKKTSSCQKPSLIRPTYVMNCSASSLFGKSNSKGSHPSESCSPITTLPLLPKNSSPQAQQKVTVPLAKVYTTLKSLATQLEKTGEKPKGTQFVMFKAVNGSVLLKVEPEALLPGNLEALHKTAFASVLSKQKTQITSNQNITKPSEPTMGSSSTATTSATNSYQNLMNYYPMPLTANSVSHSQAVSSTCASNQNRNIPQQEQCNQMSSTIASSFSVTSSVQNVQNIQSSSSVLSSSSISGRHVSILTTSQSGNPPHSSQTLRSLLRMTSNSNAYNDTNSALTRVPPNSSLLPERQKKRPSDSLSEEEKFVKRQKLEAKYPLPPGVIIKSEPDTSEYDIDNNWSVTTEINTGYINPSEVVDNITTTETSERVISTSNARTDQANIRTSEENQLSGFSEIYDTDSTDTAEEDDEISDLPPILDEHPSMEKDSESFQDENKDDSPPVLQPMPTLPVRSAVEEKANPSHESISIEKKGKSSLVSEETTTKVYDSGYDSVSTSSSVESLVPGQTQDKPAIKTAKSKIQQLKELLRQKELQVENMRKKRSEMPEVDLNAL